MRAVGPDVAELPRHLTQVLSFVIAVGPVSVDMYLPAFTQIARDFAQPGLPQLTLSLYTLGLALGQLVFGPLSDRWGRRGALQLGITLYVVASLGCALAPTPFVLCAWRALAGFGGAASIVVTRALVFDIEEGDRAARRLYTIFAWMTVAPLIAPVLGGLVLRQSGWRAIFGVAAGYGAACLFLVLRVLPETLPRARRLQLSLPVLARRYAMLLRDRAFLSHALLGSSAMAALFAYLGCSPFVFIGNDRLTPLGYAWALVAISAGTVAFLRLNRWLLQRGWNWRLALRLDIGAFGLGTLLLLPLAWTTLPWWYAWLALLVCAAGFTAIQPNAQTGALAAHRALAGSATSLMSTLQYGSGALASAWLSWRAGGHDARALSLGMLVCAAVMLMVLRWVPRQMPST